jgi:hypothetical protein
MQTTVSADETIQKLASIAILILLLDEYKMRRRFEPSVQSRFG